MQHHTEAISIKYHQTDGSGILSPTALLEILQDAAIDHSDALGYTLDYMAKHQWGWAVIHWHIVLLRMPAHAETIQVQTWSNKCRKIQAERSYIIKDGTGNPIAKAMSRWVLMDFAKRKPATVPDHMIANYGTDQIPAIEGEKYPMPKHPIGTLIGQQQFTVSRCDTDTNGHTNNVKYLAWAMEDIPDTIYQNMTLHDIRVVYRKECKRHDVVQTKTYLQQNDDTQTILTFLTDIQNNILCEIQTLWHATT